MVDGGGSLLDVAGNGENIVIPYLRGLGINKLDYCINTHPDADHIGGLFAVIDQMPVEELIISRNYGDVLLQEQLIALAETREIPLHEVVAPETLELGSATIDIWVSEDQILNTDTNSGSIVLYISYGEHNILLCGDLEGENQTELLAEDLDFAAVDILQIPHHGSKKQL